MCKHPLAVLLAVSAALFSGCKAQQAPVVLYCAQDEEFANGVLRDFNALTGLSVVPKFDTEAAKSVSLYMELVAEKDRPRCDVFWNNEPLSTIRLQRKGMLQPYDSPAAADLHPFPPSATSSDHTWHGFAARARVLIVNTRLLQDPRQRPESLLALTDPRFRNQIVLSKPQAGTSATQAACLFQVLGPDKARAYYRDLKANGVQLAPGNKQVAEWVGKGKTPSGQVVVAGITDTDDALEELKDGHPVALIFPDQPTEAGKDDPKALGTLYLPNTLAILKGCPNLDGARKLVDYLLSAEVEGKLAESDSHQIPFRPELRSKLPKEVRTPPDMKVMAVEFDKAADLWDEVQKFLVEEFAG
jgi:iron(III) transport system substrate-binding protein